MKLFWFWIGTVVLLGALRFAVLPLLERRLSRSTAANLSYRAGLLAAVGTLSFVVLMAVVSLGLTLVGVLLIDLYGGNSVAAVSASLERVRHWRERWLEWTPLWGIGIGILLLLALVIFTARKASIRCRKAVEAAGEREFDLLFEQWKREELEDLPPSDEMKQLWQRREEAITALEQLPPDDPITAPQRQQIEEYLTEVTRVFVAYDLRRRMKHNIDPDLVRIPQARNRWEKIQTIFISQGLLLNLNRANRIIFACGLLLLFPCLISVSRPLGLASIEAKMSQLGMLRVRLSAEEVKAAWEAEKRKVEGQTVLTAEDAAAISAIAQEWEEEEADAPFLSTTVSRLAPNFAVRAVSARDRILRRAAEKRPELLEHRKVGDPDASVGPAHAEVIPEAGDKGPHGPQTASGKRVQAELSEKAARAPPKFMERLRNEVAAFQKPTTSKALRRAVAAQFVSAVVDGNTANSILLEVAQAVDSRQRELLRARSEVAADHFLTSLARGESVDEAIRRSRAPETIGHLFTPTQLDDLQHSVRRASTPLPDNERLVRHFQDHPPSLETKPDVEANRRAAAVLDDYRRISKREATQLASLTESLNSYPDYFPGQLGADERTPRSDLTRKWEGGADSLAAGISGPNAKPRPPSVSGPPTRPVATRANFTRARSFAGLRGFSRVGGVLIGREPEAGAELKIESLRWEMVPEGRVQLILRDTSGKEYRSMAHRTEVVAQALTYAADGRPLAVTMATAQPLLELKILLHPALVDTQLGRSIIELDRFVDIYTLKANFRVEATQRMQQQVALYRLAWAKRILLLESAITQKAKRLSVLFAIANRWLADDTIRQGATEGMQTGALLLDGSTVIEVKSEFYDRSLVAAMKKSPQTDLDSFLAGIKSSFELVAFELRGLIEADLEGRTLRSAPRIDADEILDNWEPLPPKFQIWSGVREKPYSLTPSNLLVTGGESISMPFDFILQVAFTSEPQFGAARTQEEGVYTDTKPWEFPTIKKDAIQNNVLAKVEADREQGAVLREASEFALLQRLFRCAFEGRFGEDFPVESLTQLATELGKSDRANVNTPRWNTDPGAIEYALSKLIDIPAELATDAITESLRPCADLLKRNTERRQRYRKDLAEAHVKNPDPATLDRLWMAFDADLQTWETEWAAAAAKLQAEASESPTLAAPLEGFDELNAALKLRRALSVQSEERPSLRSDYAKPRRPVPSST